MIFKILAGAKCWHRKDNEWRWREHQTTRHIEFDEEQYESVMVQGYGEFWIITLDGCQIKIRPSRWELIRPARVRQDDLDIRPFQQTTSDKQPVEVARNYTVNSDGTID